MARISEEMSSDIRARIWCCGKTQLSIVSFFQFDETYFIPHQARIGNLYAHRASGIAYVEHVN